MHRAWHALKYSQQKEIATNPKLQKPVPVEKRNRINREIRAHSVLVIANDGERLGIMPPLDAFNIARERGLDLVEVAPDARPPVCKIMDYGRFKYQESKRTAPKPKSEMKTITLRPKTGEHDLETKLNQARKFLLRGDKVKFEVRMKGREKSRPEMWAARLSELIGRLGDVSVITQRPGPDGRGISAMLDPLKTNKPPVRAANEPDEDDEDMDIDDDDDDDDDDEAPAA